MAPQGPMLPRKSTSLRHSKTSLEGVAYQVGVMLAVERNRWRLTQSDLAAAVGIDQVDVSSLENGRPTGVSDRSIEAVFRTLQLPPKSAQASFVKWWRENSTL